jgi:hypothetical protein
MRRPCERARFGSVLPVLPRPRGVQPHVPSAGDLTTGVLSARRGRPAGTPFGFWVRALRVVVPGSKCGVCCLSLVGPRVGGTSDIPVEALFPEGRERFELDSTGCLWVLGIDPVGGPPHCDFADEGDARVSARRCPDWLGGTLAGVVLDLVGEVGD